MDFEFTSVAGQPIATVQDEQRAFGDWLTNDMGSDIQKLNTLIEMCKLLISEGLREYHWQSAHYLLQIENHEVVIAETGLLNDEDALAELDDSLNVDEHSHRAECGLEDFSELLEQWLDYIS